jgi:cytochrome c551
MIKKRVTWFLVVLGLMLTLTACGGGETDTPQDEGQTGTEESTTEKSTNDTGGNDATLVAQGEEAFKKSCIGCHGANLEGGAGPALNNLSLSKEEIVQIIKNGRGSMPGNLAPDKEEAIAEYLLSQQ